MDWTHGGTFTHGVASLTLAEKTYNFVGYGVYVDKETSYLALMMKLRRQTLKQ